jgi:hypothetical protein
MNWCLFIRLKPLFMPFYGFFQNSIFGPQGGYHGFGTCKVTRRLFFSSNFGKRKTISAPVWGEEHE